MALDGRTARRQMGGVPEVSGDTEGDALIKFILAQAIQILEGAIVTLCGALLGFHELGGWMP